MKNSGKDRTTGWHTFRHTYPSWLDETGALIKVHQELMRHASIQTTMNVYGQAMSSSKREENGNVVEMVLKPLKRAPKLHFCLWESVSISRLS
jgi:integrase